MGKTLIRIATWAGVLGACALLWLAYTARHVDPAVFRARIEQRLAELDALGAPAPAVDPEREERLLAAAQLGACLSLVGGRASLGGATGRVIGRGHSKGVAPVTVWDRQVILDDFGVRVHVQNYLHNRAVTPPEELQASDRMNQIRAAVNILCLDLSMALDRHEEERAIRGFGALMSLATDLVRDENPESWKLGEFAFQSAFRAAYLFTAFRSSIRWPEVRGSHEEEEANRILRSIPSPAGRKQLRAALSRLLSALPGPEEAWILSSRHTLREFQSLAEDYPDGVPMEWMEALETSIDLYPSPPSVGGPMSRDELIRSLERRGQVMEVSGAEQRKMVRGLGARLEDIHRIRTRAKLVAASIDRDPDAEGSLGRARAQEAK